RVPLRSSYPRPLSHGDGGAVGDKGGRGFRAQTFDEPIAVNPLHVALESRFAGSPDFPARMLDPIFDAAAVALRRVAPVMFCDELLLRTFDERARFSGGLHADVMPRSIVAPRIFDRSIRRDRSVVQIDSMAHSPRDVIFVVNDAGHGRDRPSRRDFFDECHAAPPAVFRTAADVKSQVDLFKVLVEGNRQTEDARLQKEESDDTDEMTVIPRVEFHAARYERTQRRRIDFVIEHRQSSPFRREKFSCLRLDSSHSESVPLRSSLNQKSPRSRSLAMSDAMKRGK